MKNQFSLWSRCLNKLLAYSFIVTCICAMQSNLLAHTKNTQNLSQKNSATADVFSDQHSTQSISLMDKLANNKISSKITFINEEEDEELRERARKAERDAAAAREAAEDAAAEARSNSYDDPYYYNNAPFFGFSVGGGSRYRYRGGHRGRYHHGGGHRGGRRYR